MSTNNEIPSSWITTEIEAVLDPCFNGKTIQQGWSPKCERFPSEGNEKWGVLKTTAIQEGEFRQNENKQLPEHLDPKEQIEVQTGDIVMTCAGPRQRCGVACLVSDTRPKLMMSGKMYRFRPVEQHFNSRYLEFILHSQEAKKAIDRMKTGINDSGLNLTHDRFRKLIVPVAPKNEQDRIVTKIEELFSELDKGIESLKRAREQLKVYRQALLKHAFEGKLTEQWRKDNADKLETADQLLARIKQAREDRYQQQLEEWNAAIKQWKAKGTEGKKPVKPKKILDIQMIPDDELATLPLIPENWIWVRYGDLCSVVRNGISKKPVGEEGEKIFRISAVRPMFFDMNDYRIINNQDREFDDYFLHRGDLVFTRYNGSRRYVGVCANYSSDERRLFPDKLIQTRPNLSLLSASFLEKALNSGGSREFIESKIRTTAGQSGISGGDIKNTPVPVCSEHEQQSIVQQLETVLSIINENEKAIDRGLLKSEALRQSILKKAFSGQLVAQDPNDEPASVLLERIAAEKAQAAARGKKPSGSKKKPAMKKAG